VSVTKPACPECGGEIARARTGRPRRTCSDACRQKLYRHRRGEHENGFHPPFRLTPETRELLRLAIDRRRREVLRARDVADRELFREAS
jgi:hypothetical protein